MTDSPTGDAPRVDASPFPPILAAEPPVDSGVPPLSRGRAVAEAILCSSYPTQVVAAIALSAAGVRASHADGTLDPRFVVGIALGDTLLVTCLITWLLHRRGETVRAVALGLRPVAAEIVSGIWLVPVVMLGVSLLIAGVRVLVPGAHNVAENPLTSMMVDGPLALGLGLAVVVSGGVREELQRAFQLHRLAPGVVSPAMALVVTSLAFGLGHTLQGYDVAVGTGALGALWGWLYLRRRSLVAAATCHALFNFGQIALAALASRVAPP